jgi:hypothetical protein
VALRGLPPENNAGGTGRDFAANQGSGHHIVGKRAHCSGRRSLTSHRSLASNRSTSLEKAQTSIISIHQGSYSHAQRHAQQEAIGQTQPQTQYSAHYVTQCGTNCE